jgi:hypothetical protein
VDYSRRTGDGARTCDLRSRSRLTCSASERARNGGDLSAAVVGFIGPAEQPLYIRSGESRDSYACDVPVEEVAARDLRAGDVVRLDDPQAHRVERVVLAGGRVVVDLRPIGLDVPDALRVTLPADRLVDRLGRAGD